jgi:predicted DNA-binding transcriptional regulator AlpA
MKISAAKIIAKWRQYMLEQSNELKPQQIINEADTARYIGMSRVWLRQSRMRKTGPEYIRIGRAIRYVVPELDRFLEAHRVKPHEARLRKM